MLGLILSAFSFHPPALVPPLLQLRNVHYNPPPHIQSVRHFYNFLPVKVKVLSESSDSDFTKTATETSHKLMFRAFIFIINNKNLRIIYITQYTLLSCITTSPLLNPVVILTLSCLPLTSVNLSPSLCAMPSCLPQPAAEQQSVHMSTLHKHYTLACSNTHVTWLSVTR